MRCEDLHIFSIAIDLGIELNIWGILIHIIEDWIINSIVLSIELYAVALLLAE